MYLWARVMLSSPEVTSPGKTVYTSSTISHIHHVPADGYWLRQTSNSLPRESTQANSGPLPAHAVYQAEQQCKDCVGHTGQSSPKASQSLVQAFPQAAG